MVACGFHGGDPITMLASTASPPAPPDLLGLGRRRMAISPQDA
jgi:lactam utilization protein B